MPSSTTSVCGSVVKRAIPSVASELAMELPTTSRRVAFVRTAPAAWRITCLRLGGTCPSAVAPAVAPMRPTTRTVATSGVSTRVRVESTGVLRIGRSTSV